MCVCERERERESGCYDWHHTYLTHVAIYIFRALLLLASLIHGWLSAWGLPAPPTNVSALLTADSVWPTVWPLSRNIYIFSGRPHIISPDAILWVLFHCLLFTLRRSCISCLQNLRKPAVKGQYDKIDATLISTTSPGQSEPGSNCNEWLFHIPRKI